MVHRNATYNICVCTFRYTKSNLIISKRFRAYCIGLDYCMISYLKFYQIKRYVVIYLIPNSSISNKLKLCIYVDKVLAKYKMCVFRIPQLTWKANKHRIWLDFMSISFPSIWSLLSKSLYSNSMHHFPWISTICGGALCGRKNALLNTQSSKKSVNFGTLPIVCFLVTKHHVKKIPVYFPTSLSFPQTTILLSWKRFER